MKPSAIIAMAWLAVAAGLRADELPAIADPGFEQAEPGKEPAAWPLRPLARSHGYAVRVTDANPHGGQRCLEISLPMSMAWGRYGVVTQSLPAAALRGQRVQLKAAVRADATGGRSYAGLFVRVVRPDFKPGHWNDSAEQPVRAAAWTDAVATVDVAADAERLEVGFLLNDIGKAWFDDVSLAVVGTAGAGNIAPRPLVGRGLANLVAFARLLGYVRYFHPSDQAAAADWERFAIDAIEVVEPAATPEELSARLTELFAPYAPTVQVYAEKIGPPLPDVLINAPPTAKVLAWKHVGVDLKWMGGYQSTRVADPAARPGDPFRTDLGGGVRCRVPVALYAAADGTLPKPTARPRPPARPAPFRPTGDDRSTRLAGVCLVWNIMQHFYPFFDEVTVDWPGVLRDGLTRAATDADAAAFNDTLRRLIAKLEDGHGVVRGGSGTAFLDGALPIAWDWVENQVVVVNADPKHAGRVKPGDVVTKIDGQPAGPLVRATEELVSGATPQFRRYRALMDLRNGPAGSSVTLELKPPAGAAYAVTLTRQPGDDTPLRGPGLREARLERLVELKPGVWYVDLDRFGDGDFNRVALPKLLTAKAAVFDVRGYPTVDVSVLARLTDRPLSSELYQHVVTRRPDRTGTTFEGQPWGVPPKTPRLTLKAAFLTDGRAVSYAETFMAMVARHHLGPIVGGPTSGTNGGVNLYVAPGGYRVSYTGQKARKLDGSRHHGVGVLPTHPVERTIKAIAAGRDEVLEKALELVGGK